MELPETLRSILGVERSLRGVAQALHFAVAELAPPATGALHVTCADETELECASAFLRGFARYVLPPLKMGHQAPMRLATLGGAYEWGTLGVAEDHFATARGRSEWLLVVVKINTHVGRLKTDEGMRFGWVDRYEAESRCCGLMHALLDGVPLPAVLRLQEAFASEGKDRLAYLRDEARVPLARRALDAAIVAARLQARSALLDIQHVVHEDDVLWLVLPAVTINQPGPDGELLVGAYLADGRGEDLETHYVGLGDDPAAYVFTASKDRVEVRDPGLAEARAARDHRSLVLQTWRDRGEAVRVDDPRLGRLRREVAERRHHDARHAHGLLRAILIVLADVAPGPAAVLLFAHGAAGIHHAFRVHQLSRSLGEREHASRVLHEVHERVDRLETDEAAALVELLLAEYR